MIKKYVILVSMLLVFSAFSLAGPHLYSSGLITGINIAGPNISSSGAGIDRPLFSTENVVVYVNKTGGKDYTTIQSALDDVPYFLSHRYTIYIDAGDYDEDVIINALTLVDSIDSEEGAVGGLEIYGSAFDASLVTINSLSVVGVRGSNTPSIGYVTIDDVEPRSDENVSVSVYNSNHPSFLEMNITGNSNYAIMAYSSNIYTANVTYSNQPYGVLLKRNSVSTHGDVSGFADKGSVSSAYLLVNSGYAEVVDTSVSYPSLVNCGYKGGFLIDGRTDTLHCIDQVLTSDVYVDQNGNTRSFEIDSEAWTAGVMTIEAQNTDGNVVLVRNNANHLDSTNAVLMVVQEDASSVGMAAFIRNDGTGPTLGIDGGTCTSGKGAYLYEAAGELYVCDNGGVPTLLS